MILLTHIAIALLSLAATGWAAAQPSRPKIRLSYGLISATILSGSYIVINTKAQLAPACLTGLIYLAVNLAGLVLARRRLANQAV